MADAVGEEAPVPLPSAKAVTLGEGITLQPPLSRRGNGPGIIIACPRNPPQPTTSEFLPPLQKWAEEGYAVVEIDTSEVSVGIDVGKLLSQAVVELNGCASCEGEKFGLIIYDPVPWDWINQGLHANPEIVAAVKYSGAASGSARILSTIPFLQHLAGKQETTEARNDRHEIYEYPNIESLHFAFPGHPDFDYAAESVSHTRNLTFLKKHIGGPYFDLEAIWKEHTRFEFADRSVEKTMGTMVQEPYVNHIPTMTGGIGRERLSNFYRHHFIFNNPEDTDLELVSRTVGIDRVIDEFVFSFTHNKVIDWILPGVPPTGRSVRVPFTSVVNIRGDRLYHEHIAWDQASVLVQVGLLPEYLPFPYALPNGTKPRTGKRFEYRVPAAGADTAKKIMDRNSVPSNEMFEFKIREVNI